MDQLDCKQLLNNLKDLNGYLQKAAKNGSFDLDEAVHIKNIIIGFNQSIITLDKLQQANQKSAKSENQP